MATAKTTERTPAEVIKSLEVGKFATLKKIDQGGTLQARRLSTGGVQFYWRFTHEGTTDRVAIGTYDIGAAPRSLGPTAKGYSIAAAVEACRVKATIQREHSLDGGYREHAAAKRREADVAKAHKAHAGRQTLSLLLDAYVAHLEAEGRRSASDAKSIFRLHVVEAYPAIANGAAGGVTPTQITDMLRRLIERGNGRTANKLRAYVRAAYQCALDVHSLPSIPASFKVFGIATNPAALTKRAAAHDKADKNPLVLADLRKYWTAIKDKPGIAGAALRLHLLTGGQRIEQLVKLRNADARDHEIAIYDAKGRPGQGPRRHTVQLLPLAVAALKSMRNTGDYLMSTDSGETHISAMTMSNWAKAAVTDIPDFQLKRVRSGVETALAAAGISKEVRGQLQSHGLSGVQARHYDAYDYAREKRQALTTLHRLLEAGTPAKRSSRSQPEIA
ncbi:MAG: integrase [Ideonella sp.]|nr:integrase [Ideonella sp.]